MSTVVQRRERALLIASLAFLAFSLLVSSRTWLLRATAPASRSHAVLRISLPGLDLGADAIPARPGAAGYIEVWAEPHDADDIQLLLHLFGAPALPLQAAPRSPPPGAAPRAPIPLQPAPREPQIFL
jgi:hypothetical protein